MSIYIEGNELRNGTVSNSTVIATFSDDRARIALAGARFDREDLLEIAKFTEEVNRPRVISQTGNNLFRGLEGAIGDSNPIGSIEDGPVFAPPVNEALGLTADVAPSEAIIVTVAVNVTF